MVGESTFFPFVILSHEFTYQHALRMFKKGFFLKQKIQLKNNFHDKLKKISFVNLTIYLKLLISFSFISSLFFSKAKANIDLTKTRKKTYPNGS